MSSRNIRFGVLTEESNDAGPHKLVRAKADGKPMDVKVWETYGVQASPTKDSDMLILSPDGDDGKAVGFIIPPPAKRTSGQKPGEVSYPNHLTGNTIVHDVDGNTIIKTPSGSITKHFKNGQIGFQPAGGQKVYIGDVNGVGCFPVVTTAGPSSIVYAKK